MSRRPDEPGSLDTAGARFWEDHYRRLSDTTSGRPSVALVQFADGRAPGRALDLGCARGDDAVWLARQGWDVTGVDVSATALDHAREAAERAGVGNRTVFERHDLAFSFPRGRFDLVSALFLHAPVEFSRPVALRRAAAALAPGGLLLSVTLASVAPWSWSDVDTVFPTAEEELDTIGLKPGEWTRVFVGTPRREPTGPGGQTANVT